MQTTRRYTVNELEGMYKRVEYLHNNGVKMKEIADWINMAPSVLSAFYSSVLPAYLNPQKTKTQEEALDEALTLVDNVSKKRLLDSLSRMKERLFNPEPDQETNNMGDTFLKLLEKEMQGFVEEMCNYSGIYLGYSLSSLTDDPKAEPYPICASESNDYVKVGMINAYKSVHWGSGIINSHQNSYLIFDKRELPQFAIVTIYLQLPHYECPNMLKGLYLYLDYNHSPIVRRIILMKQLNSTDIDVSLKMEDRLIPEAELTPEEEIYYDYTCREGDYIKTYTAPSPKLDESDLEGEKKMLKI